MSAPDARGEAPDLGALRDLVADIINAESPAKEEEAERRFLATYEIRLRVFAPPDSVRDTLEEP